MDTILILFLALAIDLTLGEPPSPIHPVVWMGKLIALLERYGTGRSHVAQLVYGVAMVLFLVALFTVSTCFILFYLKGFSTVAYVIVAAALLKSAFSLKGLYRTALRIKKLLMKDELDEVRFELRSLVSRDTRNLTKPLLVSATVESVAENTCDSFIAPWFYFLVFGVPGAIAYRVVNTLDSMIGYHGRYEYLGKFASKLDDVLNFIPARLTALLLILTSFLSRGGARASWQAALSEHSRTESPNAGWTMAAVAGALDVQLEKEGSYKLGRASAPLSSETIDDSLQLMQIAAVAWVVICFVVEVIRFVIAS